MKRPSTYLSRKNLILFVLPFVLVSVVPAQALPGPFNLSGSGDGKAEQTSNSGTNGGILSSLGSKEDERTSSNQSDSQSSTSSNIIDDAVSAGSKMMDKAASVGNRIQDTMSGVVSKMSWTGDVLDGGASGGKTVKKKAGSPGNKNDRKEKDHAEEEENGTQEYSDSSAEDGGSSGGILEEGGEMVGKAIDRGKDAAGSALEKGKEVTGSAVERGKDLGGKAVTKGQEVYGEASSVIQTGAKKVTTQLREDAELVGEMVNPDSRSRVTIARELLWPKIGKGKRIVHGEIGGATYTLHSSERVGLIEGSLQDVENTLRELGFSRNPVAAFKSRETGEPSSGSWRFTKDDFQYHVTLFQLEEGIEVNAHRELRWEPDFDVGNPAQDYEHYPEEEIPDWMPEPLERSYLHDCCGKYSPKEGVEFVRTLFEEHDVDFRRPESYE